MRPAAAAVVTVLALVGPVTPGPPAVSSASASVTVPVPASVAEAAATTRKATLRLSTPTVTVGDTVKLRGKVTRTPRKTKVLLQRKAGKRWVKAAAGRTDRRGKVAFTVTATSTGRTTYRLLAKPTRKLRRAVSKPRRLTVTALPPLVQTLVSQRHSPAGDDHAAGGVSDPAISDDGRYVVFTSSSGTLVPGVTPGDGQVYLRDLATGATTLVSRDTGGTQGDETSEGPDISANGRWVVYRSAASDLVTGVDPGTSWDVFRWDRTTGATVLVSHDPGGGPADGAIYDYAVSDLGTVVFASSDTDLVPGDTNSASDVFLYNETGALTRVSRDGLTQGNADSSSPDISADGRFVAFRTYATNLLYGFDNGAGQILRRSLLDGSYVGISAQDGQPGYGTYGTVGSPAISGDGRYVAFTGTAGDLVTSPPPGGSHIYLRDTVNATTAGVTRTPAGWADGGSGSPAISSDGRWVAFDSYAANLSPADTGTLADVYVFDRSSGAHRLVSVDAAGHPAEDGGYAPGTSADGRYVVFVTSSSNLSPLDLNQDSDVYRWDAQGTR